MKLDPNDSCVIFDEHLRWALIHDFFAHPLMALTFYSKMSVKFHNWTSHKAWKRNGHTETVEIRSSR